MRVKGNEGNPFPPNLPKEPTKAVLKNAHTVKKTDPSRHFQALSQVNTQKFTASSEYEPRQATKVDRLAKRHFKVT